MTQAQTVLAQEEHGRTQFAKGRGGQKRRQEQSPQSKKEIVAETPSGSDSEGVETRGVETRGTNQSLKEAEVARAVAAMSKRQKSAELIRQCGIEGGLACCQKGLFLDVLMLLSPAQTHIE